MDSPTLFYLTTDPLNAYDARFHADALGVPLELGEPRDLPCLERDYADVVLDWDFLPADLRSRLLNGSAARVSPPTDSVSPTRSPASYRAATSSSAGTSTARSSSPSRPCCGPPDLSS